MILPTYNILESITAYTSPDDPIAQLVPLWFYSEIFTSCNNDIEERSFETQEKLIKLNNEKQLIIRMCKKIMKEEETKADEVGIQLIDAFN
jgi:hypothetical protein